MCFPTSCQVALSAAVTVGVLVRRKREQGKTYQIRGEPGDL